MGEEETIDRLAWVLMKILMSVFMIFLTFCIILGLFVILEYLLELAGF